MFERGGQYVAERLDASRITVASGSLHTLFLIVIIKTFMDSRVAFFAVAQGRVPGVYQGWEAVAPHVRGFANAHYRWFSTRAEAELWLRKRRVRRPPRRRKSRVPRQRLRIPSLISDADNDDDDDDDENKAEAEELYICCAGAASKSQAGAAWETSRGDHHATRLDPRVFSQTRVAADLWAVLSALRHLVPRAADGSRITVVTESDYIHDEVLVYRHHWARNQWRVPVEERDLVRRLCQYLDSTRVHITLVRPAANDGNHDALLQKAQAAAEKKSC